MAVLFLVWGAVVACRVWYDRKVPNFSGVQHVYVYPDMSLEEVEDGILASGQVKKPASLKRVFKEVQAVKPGHYLVDSTCTSMYVKRMLEKGWQTPVNLTLSGSIRREADLARKIASQMMVDSAQVASFVGSNDSLSRYCVKRAHLFTLIIPVCNASFCQVAFLSGRFFVRSPFLRFLFARFLFVMSPGCSGLLRPDKNILRI